MSWVDEYSERMRGKEKPPRNAPKKVWEDWRKKTGISYHNGGTSYQFKQEGITKRMRREKHSKR